MNPRDFCYWLQGGFELNPNLALNTNTVEMIKKHLDMTIVHVNETDGSDNESSITFNRPPGQRC